MAGTNARGYRKVGLKDDNGTYKPHLVHRLVAAAFRLDISQAIDHINEIKNDNRLENLRACSLYENSCFYHKRDPADKGVVLSRGRYAVTYYVDSKTPYFVGRYKTKAEAVKIYADFCNNPVFRQPADHSYKLEKQCNKCNQVMPNTLQYFEKASGKRLISETGGICKACRRKAERDRQNKKNPNRRHNASPYQSGDKNA